MRLTLVVENPDTNFAKIYSSKFHSLNSEGDIFLYLTNTNNDNIDAIEPTITADGKLIFYNSNFLYTFFF